jgi:hypothetical protein
MTRMALTRIRKQISFGYRRAKGRKKFNFGEMGCRERFVSGKGE